MFLFNIKFLSYIYIIIYVGAIALLFVFVVLMVNLKEISEKKEISYEDKIVCFMIILKFFFMGRSFLDLFSGELKKQENGYANNLLNISNDQYLYYLEKSDILVFKNLFTIY